MPSIVQTHIFGHLLPGNLVRSVIKNGHIPLLSENWFVASIVWGGSITTLIFIFFGSVFFVDDPTTNSVAIYIVLVIALIAGFINGLAGLVVYWKISNSSQGSSTTPLPEFHKAVAIHRKLVAILLAIFGLAGLWHAWSFSFLTGIFGTLIFAMEVVLGFVALPSMLAFLSGQSKQLASIAHKFSRLLLLGIGFVSAIITLPIVARAEPGSFFLLLTQLLSLLTLPWVAPMLAASRIHVQHATQLSNK